jgi:Holliday junction resolvase RusA-like endonuclease
VLVPDRGDGATVRRCTIAAAPTGARRERSCSFERPSSRCATFRRTVLIERPARPPDLHVIVIGEAKTKGSTQSHVATYGDGTPVRTRDGRIKIITRNDAGPAAEAWQASVAARAAEARDETGLPFLTESGVWVDLTFVRPRNKGHHGTGRNSGLVRGSAPAFPAVRPDLDKQIRLALDGLKGVVYKDDGQVVAVQAGKVFGEPARLELGLWVLPSTVADLEFAAQTELSGVA